jgi:hypothetical protein
MRFDCKGQNRFGACGVSLQTLPPTFYNAWCLGLKRNQAVEKVDLKY